MAAAADPAKTAPFRGRFARVAFNAFAITRQIYVFQGARPIVRRNISLVRTLPIEEGSRTVQPVARPVPAGCATASIRACFSSGLRGLSRTRPEARSAEFSAT